MTYFARIEREAEAIRKANPNLTHEQSIARAAEENPDLVEAYRRETRGEQNGETSGVRGPHSYAKLERIAKGINKQDPSLTPEQAFVRAAEQNPGLLETYREGR